MIPIGTVYEVLPGGLQRSTFKAKTAAYGGLNLPAIIGGAVAGFVVLLCLLLACFVSHKRKQRRKREQEAALAVVAAEARRRRRRGGGRGGGGGGKGGTLASRTASLPELVKASRTSSSGLLPRFMVRFFAALGLMDEPPAPQSQQNEDDAAADEIEGQDEDGLTTGAAKRATYATQGTGRPGLSLAAGGFVGLDIDDDALEWEQLDSKEAASDPLLAAMLRRRRRILAAAAAAADGGGGGRGSARLHKMQARSRSEEPPVRGRQTAAFSQQQLLRASRLRRMSAPVVRSYDARSSLLSSETAAVAGLKGGGNIRGEEPRIQLHTTAGAATMAVRRGGRRTIGSGSGGDAVAVHIDGLTQTSVSSRRPQTAPARPANNRRPPSTTQSMRTTTAAAAAAAADEDEEEGHVGDEEMGHDFAPQRSPGAQTAATASSEESRFDDDRRTVVVRSSHAGSTMSAGLAHAAGSGAWPVGTGGGGRVLSRSSNYSAVSGSARPATAGPLLGRGRASNLSQGATASSAPSADAVAVSITGGTLGSVGGDLNRRGLPSISLPGLSAPPPSLPSSSLPPVLLPHVAAKGVTSHIGRPLSLTSAVGHGASGMQSQQLRLSGLPPGHLYALSNASSTRSALSAGGLSLLSAASGGSHNNSRRILTSAGLLNGISISSSSNASVPDTRTGPPRLGGGSGGGGGGGGNSRPVSAGPLSRVVGGRQGHQPSAFVPIATSAVRVQPQGGEDSSASSSDSSSSSSSSTEEGSGSGDGTHFPGLTVGFSSPVGGVSAAAAVVPSPAAAVATVPRPLPIIVSARPSTAPSRSFSSKPLSLPTVSNERRPSRSLPSITTANPALSGTDQHTEEEEGASTEGHGVSRSDDYTRNMYERSVRALKLSNGEVVELNDVAPPPSPVPVPIQPTAAVTTSASTGAVQTSTAAAASISAPAADSAAASVAARRAKFAALRRKFSRGHNYDDA